jgi:hypothetical protein
MYCRKYAVEQVATVRNLTKLEHDSMDVADDPRANFDQPGLQAGQRPIGHLLGEVCALQEYTKIVGSA